MELIKKIYKYIKMKKGTIKFFNQPQGWGMIIEEGTGNDLFFHVTKTVGYQPGKHISFNEGDYVLFNQIEGKKGPEAVDVLRGEGGSHTMADDADEDDAS
jgi:cold shock protein